MSIKEFNEELQEAKRDYAIIKRDITKRRDEWIGKIWPKFKLGEHYITDNEIDQWECPTSPIGICVYVYSSESPLGDDACVFCHLPMKRLQDV